jgi:hypothetical protein
MTVSATLALVTLFGFQNMTEKNALLEQSLKQRQTYADTKGLELLALPYDGQLDRFKASYSDLPCPALKEKSRFFNKLAALLLLMDERPSTEWFWYQDLDAVITNWNVNALSLLSTTPDHQHLVACVHRVGHLRHLRRGRTCTTYNDRRDGFFALNAGLFFVRNSAASRDILTTAICSSHSTNVTWQRLARNLGETSEDLAWSDQAALTVALELHPSCPVRMLPQRTFNSQAHKIRMDPALFSTPTCVYWRPGDWVAHGFGCRDGAICLKLLRTMLFYGQAAADGRLVDLPEYQSAESRLPRRCQLPEQVLDYNTLLYVSRYWIASYLVVTALAAAALLYYLRSWQPRWCRWR